ncbi:hypothetical protein ACX3YD_22170 [Pseudomonas fluorescens group sp. PF-1]
MTKDKTVTMSRELAELEFSAFWEQHKLDLLERKIGRSDCKSIWLNARKIAAPVVERQEPVAWRHTMHYENRCGHRFVLTDSAESPFGKPDVDYDKLFRVTCEPLFTSPPAPVAVVLPKPVVWRIPISGDWFYGTKEQCEREYAEYTADFTTEDFDEDGPFRPEPLACLDKVKELNQ